MISHLEALCRALWLVDPTLRDVRTADVEPRVAMAMALEALGVRDEGSARSAVERFYSSSPDLLGNCTWLFTELLGMRGGEPVLQAQLPIARRLLRIVDPDPLAVLGSNLGSSRDDALDWRGVPLDDGGAIANLLCEGSWETHIHLGGALPPCYYWLLLMGGEMGYETLGWIRSARRSHAKTEDWERAVARAAWLRLALALQVELASPPQRAFPHLPPLTDAAWEPWQEVTRIPAELWPLSIRDSLLRLSRSQRGWPQGRSEETDWAFAEPLRGPARRGRQRHYAEGERRLLVSLRELLRQPREQGREKVPLEKWLLEYLRTRNTFHSLLVHDQGSDGLIRFVETFDRRGFAHGTGHGGRQARLRRHRLKLERCRMVAALDSQLVEPFDGVYHDQAAGPQRSLEMRVTIPRGPLILRTLRAWCEGISRHLQPCPDTPGPRSRIGLVFHLIKAGESPEHVRRASEDAERLCWILLGYPGLRPLVVGLDAAGHERLAPPRVFAKAFQTIQKLVAEHRIVSGQRPIRVGFTYHAGEDVVDFLTGLRHLDEAASLLLPPEAGGRLGHALVLGDDPRRFYASRGLQTEPPLGAHLLDLVWAWGRLTDASGLGNPEGLFRRIAELMPMARVERSHVVRCYRGMRLESPAEPPLSEKTLLDELGFAGDGLQPVPTPATEEWLDLIKLLQKILQSRFSLRRITIEANPTSNLVIGGFQGYADLPVQALVAAGLPVSLNTDDPGLFMTSLPGEFASLYQVLERQNMPHRQIVVWLRDRIFDAAQSTFLGPGPPGPADRQELDRMFRYERGGL